MYSPYQGGTIKQASTYDNIRVLTSVIGPTLAKGVIKRRPAAVAVAQHHGLDTKAVELLQTLRNKYEGSSILLGFPLRPQVLVLDLALLSQVLHETPTPFTPATTEKKSALAHFEPGNILISAPSRRTELRPIHEEVLATANRAHPLADHCKAIIERELAPLFPNVNDHNEAQSELNWDMFSQVWFRSIRTIVLGQAARDDDDLTNDFDAIRKRGNWGYMASKDETTLRLFRQRVEKYLRVREEGSLVSRLPSDNLNLDLDMQVAHWLFAFGPAGMATFRALALLGCQPPEREKVLAEKHTHKMPRPHSRAVFLESLRLWPTTPIILRELTEDRELGGQRLRKGTGFIIFAPLYHRDSERLENSDRMSASIWSGMDFQPSLGLVPFSGGSGLCPAHNFVPLLTSIAIDAVVSRTKVALLEPSLDPTALPGTLNYYEIRLQLSNHITSPS